MVKYDKLSKHFVLGWISALTEEFAYFLYLAKDKCWKCLKW